MLGALMFCCGLQNGFSQKVEWTYKFPSIAAGRTLSTGFETRYTEFGLYEIGFYFKNKLGLAFMRSLGYGRLTWEGNRAWQQQLNQEFEGVLTDFSTSQVPNQQTSIKLFHRIVNSERFTLEPHAALTLFRFLPRFIEENRAWYLYEDEVIAWLEPERYVFGTQLGLLAEWRMNELGFFCNVIWKPQPTSQVVGFRRNSENTLKRFHTSRREGAALYAELGLRVRIENPFSWLKIK